MSEIERLRNEILEMEEEIREYDFGSYPYDVLNGELEYSYSRLASLEKALTRVDDRHDKIRK